MKIFPDSSKTHITNGWKNSLSAAHWKRLFVKHKQNITKLKPVYDNIKYWKETSIYTNITDNKIFNSGSSREVRRRYEISATSFVWIMKICEIG